MSGTAIGPVRGTAGYFGLFDSALASRRHCDGSTSGFRHVAAALGRDGRGVGHERTIRHSARTRHCSRRIVSSGCFFNWLLGRFWFRATTVRGRRFTTVALYYNRARLIDLGAHRLHIGAAKKAPTSHPHRNCKGQENARDLDEQGRFHQQQSTPKNTKVQRPCKCYVTSGLLAYSPENTHEYRQK